MQQVPAVEIDGVTLSQSVSPSTLSSQIFYSKPESVWASVNRTFCAHTAGSDSVHRWDQAWTSSPSGRPKETRSSSDDKRPDSLRDPATAG